MGSTKLIAVRNKIVSLAKKNKLEASSRTVNDGYGNRYRRWWFSDEPQAYRRGFLQSPECGMSDEEAIEWLTQPAA